MKTNLSVPKRIELVFDTAYLLIALVLGIILVVAFKGAATRLWGIMALLLVFGDAFHLFPRMAAAYTGDTLRFKSAMGAGKLITSITMTIFYLMLWHCGLLIFSKTFKALTVAIYILALIRILLCLLPQNKWQQDNPSKMIGIYRNIPFLLQGILVIWLFSNNSIAGSAVNLTWVAVLVSFLCYLPVVLWSAKNPKLGMLMLPKTCAYIWIITIGFFT